MARGWESKSVESQIEEKREAWKDRAVPSSPEQLEKKRRREGLESSRRGVARELESATADLRRRSLEAALRYLDDELTKIG